MQLIHPDLRMSTAMEVSRVRGVRDEKAVEKALSPAGKRRHRKFTEHRKCSSHHRNLVHIGKIHCIYMIVEVVALV